VLRQCGTDGGPGHRQETVQYVVNIDKYYVAYKMAVAQQQVREAAKQSLAK